MTLDEYMRKAKSTAIHDVDHEVGYLALALCGEAGEVADKVKKILRDDNGNYSDASRKAIAYELGDVLWYLAVLTDLLGYDLSEIANMNLDKINDRIKRGKLHGSGDNR